MTVVQNRPSDLELRRLYLDERKGCPDIARAAGCDPTTVHRWLKAAGIPIRARGDIANMGGRRRAPGWRHTPEARAKVGAASVARGAVPYLRDGKHWLKDAPPEMNPRWLGGVTAERQAFYRTPEWKAACVAVYRRADACCERCGADARKADRSLGLFDIHHIISFAVRATRAAVWNLALLCERCHMFVHSRANLDRVFLPGTNAPAYWRDGVRHLRAAERELAVPTLFDLMAVEEAA